MRVAGLRQTRGRTQPGCLRIQSFETSCTSSQAILETLARAVLVYGRRNARILYDALGTLAEAVHGALAEPMFLGIIMPPLVQKWHAVPDTDRELLPLLECFMTLAHQLGEPRAFPISGAFHWHMALYVHLPIPPVFSHGAFPNCSNPRQLTGLWHQDEVLHSLAWIALLSDSALQSRFGPCQHLMRARFLFWLCHSPAVLALQAPLSVILRSRSLSGASG